MGGGCGLPEAGASFDIAASAGTVTAPAQYACVAGHWCRGHQQRRVGSALCDVRHLADGRSRIHWRRPSRDKSAQLFKRRPKSAVGYSVARTDMDEKENFRVQLLHTNPHKHLILFIYLPHPSLAPPQVCGVTYSFHYLLNVSVRPIWRGCPPKRNRIYDFAAATESPSATSIFRCTRRAHETGEQRPLRHCASRCHAGRV